MLIGMQILRFHFKSLVLGEGVGMDDGVLTTMAHHSETIGVGEGFPGMRS